MANALPYLSMNMFNPPQVNYNSDGVPAKLAELIQNSPMATNPFTSVFLNYLIIPLILGESIAPQGQFGQALYPVDASAATKALYAARDVGEALTPSGLEFAGLATPEKVAQYMPLYRWRALSEAMSGKNQLGISGTEPASSRVLRGVASSVGVPLQAPVNTTFNANSQNNNP